MAFKKICVFKKFFPKFSLGGSSSSPLNGFTSKKINHQQDRQHWPGVKVCFFCPPSWRFSEEIAGSEVFPMQPIWVSGTQKKRRKKNGRCKWTTDWQKEMRKELWGFWRSLKAKWQILAKALFHLQMFLVGLTSFCWRLLWSTHKKFKNAGMFRGWWCSSPPFQQDHSVKAR